MSEMLTEMVPGQEDSSDLELLQVRITLAYEARAECQCCTLWKDPTRAHNCVDKSGGTMVEGSKAVWFTSSLISPVSFSVL